MIKYADKLPELCDNKISLAKILSLYKAFGNTKISPDFWIQENESVITAVLSLYGNEMTFYCNNGDLEEIWNFIRVISPKRVFTEKENLIDHCNATIKQVFLKNLPLKETVSATSVPLKKLYEKLLLGQDGDVSLPCFENFCGDISHRLRHNGAVSITKDFGAALSFIYDGGGIISGISVDKSHRNNGFGSKLLKEICEKTGGNIFACTDEKNKEFYIKNGFSYIGDIAYLEMERK
ncbi:MAG: GNAT family N-acetyltransferase [Clostridia bacterium]|nr:GNAT family N-acetyltransferase [Clostridia bacterium]